MMSSAAAAPAPVSYAKIAKGDGEAETPHSASAGNVNTTGVDIGQCILNNATCVAGKHDLSN